MKKWNWKDFVIGFILGSFVFVPVIYLVVFLATYSPFTQGILLGAGIMTSFAGLIMLSWYMNDPDHPIY